METQRIELFFIDRGEALNRTTAKKLVELDQQTLHAAVRKSLGSGIPAIIGHLVTAASTEK